MDGVMIQDSMHELISIFILLYAYKNVTWSIQLKVKFMILFITRSEGEGGLLFYRVSVHPSLSLSISKLSVAVFSATIHCGYLKF